MVRIIEKIEYELERDTWKSSSGSKSNYAMTSVMVSALEKELSETISSQNKDDHKTPDSV